VKHALDVVAVLQLGVWFALAAATVWSWARHRRPQEAWAAATFVVVAALSVAAASAPDEIDDGATLWLVKVILALVCVFPYLLYRFVTSMRPVTRTVDVLALAVTAAASLTVFAFRDLPDAGEHRSTAIVLYTVLFFGQWASLSTFVAVSLWRAGSDRPTVIRRRMRTLSVAAAGVVLALSIGVLVPADDLDDPGVAQLVTALLGLATGPLFLVGLAPPRLLLAAWRRPEEARLYDAEAALMASTTTEEVAAGLLPHVTQTIGGVGASLVADDGTVLASYGSTSGAEESIAVPIRGGQLIVAADAYAPFFGREEAVLLQRIGRLTDVALRRAEVVDRERTAAAELETANAAMREFVGIASHDLRTPIAVIKGYAQLIERADDLGEEDRRHHAGTIARQADHLSAIVGDLLTISRIDSGALEPDLQPVRIGSVVRQVLTDLGCDGEVVVDVDNDLLVSGDHDHASRIVRNLVENARHHGDAPIAVSVRRAGDAVELRVRDHGPGVPDDFRHRLFERFARSAKARGGRAAHGTGLGLSIVQGLARAGGGDAWFEPAAPGACFAVRFPAAPQEHP
jgi:signal transduction histidine kinase